MADEEFTPDGQADVPAESQAPQEAAPQIDYAALEKQAAEIAPGMTLANLADSYREARSQLGRYQNMESDYTKLKREYDVAAPLIRGVKEDAAFAQHMTQAAQDYYQGGDRPVDSGLQKALDPFQHKLQDIETRLAERDIDDQITRLKADPNFGKFLTKEVENKMWQRITDTGSGDMQAHFWAIAGPRMVEEAGKNATTSTAEQIKKANASYTPLDGSGAPQKGAQASENANPDEIIDAIGRMMAGG